MTKSLHEKIPTEYFKYVNYDISKPEYLFHGSPKLLEEIHSQQSHDSLGNINNIDNSIFVTPSFLMVPAYSFKDLIKANSKGLRWNFEVNHLETIPIMIMKNVNVDDNIVGYVYVFKNNDSFKNDPIGSLQYKYYGNLVPLDVVKVRYIDYKLYYEVKENIDEIKNVK